MLNTQPRGGGCKEQLDNAYQRKVSTHSRAEAAAGDMDLDGFYTSVSTHSRAEAAASVIADK